MKWLIASISTAYLLAMAAGPVPAHRLPEDALTLVRQASAILAQSPAMTGEVSERLKAALKSKKPQGVRLDQVAEALRAIEKGDIAAARRLLMASIMPAGMPMPPEGTRRPRPQAPGTAPSVPPPPTQPLAVPPSQPQSAGVAVKTAGPLRPRFAGSPPEIAILAAALALIGLGLTSLWRGREAVRR